MTLIHSHVRQLLPLRRDWMQALLLGLSLLLVQCAGPLGSERDLVPIEVLKLERVDIFMDFYGTKELLLLIQRGSHERPPERLTFVVGAGGRFTVQGGGRLSRETRVVRGSAPAVRWADALELAAARWQGPEQHNAHVLAALLRGRRGVSYGDFKLILGG